MWDLVRFFPSIFYDVFIFIALFFSLSFFPCNYLPRSATRHPIAACSLSSMFSFYTLQRLFSGYAFYGRLRNENQIKIDENCLYHKIYRVN